MLKADSHAMLDRLKNRTRDGHKWNTAKVLIERAILGFAVTREEKLEFFKRIGNYYGKLYGFKITFKGD